MLDKRIQTSRGVCVCQRNRTTHHVKYALGSSSIAQTFDSLCSKVFDKHPTVAPPKEQKFCAATSQNHRGRALDTTAQIKFKSTMGHKCARPSTDHLYRRPTSLNTLRAIALTNSFAQVFADSLSHNFQLYSNCSHLQKHLWCYPNFRKGRGKLK